MALVNAGLGKDVDLAGKNLGKSASLGLHKASATKKIPLIGGTPAK
jgi:hypothetical protein